LDTTPPLSLPATHATAHLSTQQHQRSCLLDFRTSTRRGSPFGSHALPAHLPTPPYALPVSAHLQSVVRASPVLLVTGGVVALWRFVWRATRGPADLRLNGLGVAEAGLGIVTFASAAYRPIRFCRMGRHGGQHDAGLRMGRRGQTGRCPPCSHPHPRLHCPSTPPFAFTTITPRCCLQYAARLLHSTNSPLAQTAATLLAHAQRTAPHIPAWRSLRASTVARFLENSAYRLYNPLRKGRRRSIRAAVRLWLTYMERRIATACQHTHTGQDTVGRRTNCERLNGRAPLFGFLRYVAAFPSVSLLRAAGV